jgi:hypothetical protein
MTSFGDANKGRVQKTEVNCTCHLFRRFFKLNLKMTVDPFTFRFILNNFYLLFLQIRYIILLVNCPMRNLALPPSTMNRLKYNEISWSSS